MKIIICLAFYLSLPSAFARSFGFCRSPLQYTCSNSDSGSRQENIEAIEEEVKNRAFSMLVSEKDRDQDEVIGELKDYTDIETITPARLRKRIQRRFYAKVRVVFASYMEQNRVPSDLGMANIKAALSTEVKADPGISAEVKNQILDIISKTRLISFHSELDETTVGDANTLFKECMKKSFIDNAFATEIRHEKVILVCPGEIIGTIEDLRSREISTAHAPLAMAMTLGHEFSHHFDYRSYPEIYSSLLKEMKAFPGVFAKEPENYMSEISADVWGLRVYRSLVKSQPASNLIDLLTPTSLNDLCGSTDDGEHPAGDFRIQTLAPKYLCH